MSPKKTIVLGLLVTLLALVSCGEDKSTTTDSRAFSTLAEKKEFLEKYASFRRSYQSLDFNISYRDGESGLVASPTEWDIRLLAEVPPQEIDQWFHDLEPTTNADQTWISEIPNAPSDLSGFKWYQDSRRTVGIDQDKRMVLYRNLAY